MTQSLRPSDVVAAQLRAHRAAEGISAQGLAERCAVLGMPSLNRSVLANIENGRREGAVSVDELFVLAVALNMPPLALLLPLGGDAKVEVAPKLEAHARAVLEWATGQEPLVVDRKERRAPWAGGRSWEVAAQPFYLFERLREMEERLDDVDIAVRLAEEPSASLEKRLDDALLALAEHHEHMRRAGLAVSKLAKRHERRIAELRVERAED